MKMNSQVQQSVKEQSTRTFSQFTDSELRALTYIAAPVMYTLSSLDFSEVKEEMKDLSNALEKAWGINPETVSPSTYKEGDKLFYYESGSWNQVPDNTKPGTDLNNVISAKDNIIAAIAYCSTAGRLLRGDRSPINFYSERTNEVEIGVKYQEEWNFFNGERTDDHDSHQEVILIEIVNTLNYFAPFEVKGLESDDDGAVKLLNQSENYSDSQFLKHSHLGVYEKSKAAITLYAVENAAENPETNYLAWSGLKEKVQEFFNGKVPGNIYFSDFWEFARDWDFDISYKELRALMKAFANATYIGATQYIKLIDNCVDEGNKSFTLWFEDKYSIVVNEDGFIYDERGRFMQSLVVKSPFCISQSASSLNEPADLYSHSKEDVILYSSYGAFLEYFFKIANYLTDDRGVIQADQVFRKHIAAIPCWCALDEIGGSRKGRRKEYDKSVSPEFQANDFLSLAPPFSHKSDGVYHLKTPGDGKELSWQSFTYTKGRKDQRLDQVVLSKYDKVRMHKGSMPFTDGSLYHERFSRWNDPVKAFLNVANSLGAYKLQEGDSVSLVDVIKYIYGITVSSEEEAETFIKEKACFSKNSKIEKATKRAALPRGVSAQMLEVEENVLAVLQEWHSSSSSDEGQEIPSIYGKFAHIPGQTIDLPANRGKGPFKIPITEDGDIENFSLKGDDSHPSIDFLYGGKTQNSLEAVTSAKWTVTWDNPLNYKVEGNTWFKTRGVRVKKGTLLTKLSSWNQGKYVKNIYAPCDMVVESITFTKEMSGNKVRGLSYNLKGFSPCWIKKSRGELKTLNVLAQNGNEVVYNDLNPNLPDGLGQVTTLDANKSWTSEEGSALSFAQTAAKTTAGQDVIQSINEYCFGLSDRETLYWDSKMAQLGCYKPLEEFILGNYQRPVWIKEEAPSKGAFSQVLYPMYKNKADDDSEEWFEVSEDQKQELYEVRTGRLNENATVFVNGTSMEDLKNNNTVILAFLFEEKLEYMFQRTNCLVGSKEMGHYYSFVKPELSAIPQMLSETDILPNVASTIEGGIEKAGLKPNPELAKYLFEGAEAKPKRWAAFNAMRKNGNFHVVHQGKAVKLPKIKLYVDGEDGQQINPKLLNTLTSYDNGRILRSAQLGKLKLKDLAEVLNDVVVCTEDFALHLPTIFQQEGEPTSNKSLAGQIKSAFIHILAAPSAKVSGASYYLGRATGLMDSLLKSASLRKMRGGTGVYAKCSSHYSVPINEIWVLYSEDPNSYYQTLKKVCEQKGISESQIDGIKGIFTRMPMPFGGGVKVRIIYPGEFAVKDKDGELLDILDKYRAFLNPFSCYIEAGDWDGDDRTFVPVAPSVPVQLLTYDINLNIIKERTGKKALATDGKSDYILDHYDCSFETKKQFNIGGNKKHLTLINRSEDVENALYLAFKGGDSNIANLKEALEELERDSLDLELLYQNSTWVQGAAVGGTHQISNITGYAWNLKQVFSQYTDSISNAYSFLDKPNWFLVAFELYENPLGGFGWEIYRLCKILMNGGKSERETDKKEPSIDDFFDLQTLADKAGLNAAEIDAMNSAAQFLKEAPNLSFDAPLPQVLGAGEYDWNLLLRTVCAFMFYIDKGQVDLTPMGDLNGTKPVGKILSYAQVVLEFPNIQELKQKSLITRLVYDFIVCNLVANINKDDHPQWCLYLAKKGILPEVISKGEVLKGFPSTEVELINAKKHKEVEQKERKEVNTDFDLSDYHTFLIKELRTRLPKSKFSVAEGYVSALEEYISPLISGLSEDQVAAIHFFFFGENHSTVLSGAGGTGKSHATNAIIEILEHCTTTQVVKTAASGSAAKSLTPDAKTFGSVSGQGIEGVTPLGEENENGNSPADLVSKLISRSGVETNSGRHIVFVVDEISMLSAEQLDVFDNTCRLAFNTNYGASSESDYPENYGFNLLLVGDMPQLPPVEGSAAYLSDVVRQSDIAGLYINHRISEEGGDFAKEILQVSEGKPLEESSILASRVNLIDRSDDEKVSLFLSNKRAKEWNQRVLYKIKEGGAKTQKYSTRVTIRGREWIYVGNNTLVDPNTKNSYIPDINSGELDFLPNWLEPEMELATGMKFMLRENDKQKRFVNGSVGIITSLNEDSITLSLDGNEVTIPMMTSQSNEYKGGEIIKSFCGLLGHPAHAITVQKSQGLTISSNLQVHLDSTSAETPGLTYTALSRVKSAEQLYIMIAGKGKSHTLLNSCIGADSEAVEFRHKAENLLKEYVDKLNYSGVSVDPKALIEGKDLTYFTVLEETGESFIIETYDEVFTIQYEQQDPLSDESEWFIEDEDGEILDLPFEEVLETLSEICEAEAFQEFNQYVNSFFNRVSDSTDDKLIIDKPVTTVAYSPVEIKSVADVIFNEVEDNMEQLSKVKAPEFLTCFVNNELFITQSSSGKSVKISFVNASDSGVKLKTTFGTNFDEYFPPYVVTEKSTEGSIHLSLENHEVQKLGVDIAYLNQKQLGKIFKALYEGKISSVGLIVAPVTNW